MDRLPTELGVRIVEQAAYTFRFSDRRSVVNLAASSKSIYAVVAPILYHTMMVVNTAGAARIKAFMFDNKTRSLAVRVCSHVRVLYHSTGVPRSVDPSLLTSLVSSYALGDITRKAMKTASSQRWSPDIPCSLRHINVLSVDFAREIAELPRYARESITHACGFLPLSSKPLTEWVRLRDTPIAWMHQITDNMPALTHLGLVLINLNRSFQGNSAVLEFDMDVLCSAIGTALECNRLEQLALRIGGGYLDQRRHDIERLLQQITDPRFRVWHDERPMLSWNDWNVIMYDDVLAGRDIWTEARAV